MSSFEKQESFEEKREKKYKYFLKMNAGDIPDDDDLWAEEEDLDGEGYALAEDQSIYTQQPPPLARQGAFHEDMLEEDTIQEGQELSLTNSEILDHMIDLAEFCWNNGIRPPQPQAPMTVVDLARKVKDRQNENPRFKMLFNAGFQKFRAMASARDLHTPFNTRALVTMNDYRDNLVVTFWNCLLKALLQIDLVLP